MAQSDDNGQEPYGEPASGRDAGEGDLSTRLSSIEVPPTPSLPPPPEIHFERPELGKRRSAASPEPVTARVNIIPDETSPKGIDRDSNAASWGRGMAASLLLASSIFVSLYIGQWLDGKFHTAPWLTLIMTLLGIAAGFVNLFRLLAATDPSKRKR